MRGRFTDTPSGFTLIELTILLVLLSIFSINLLLTTQETQSLGKRAKTQKTMEIIMQALQRYRDINGHYPCPANGTIAITSSSFGDGGQSGSAACSNHNFSHAGITIGVVPTRDLGLPNNAMFDGWNNRIMYIVTEAATQDKSCEAAIDILSNYNTGNDLATNTSNYWVDTVPYALISYGEDGYGAYSYAGARNPIAVTTDSAQQIINNGLSDNSNTSGIDEDFGGTGFPGIIIKPDTMPFTDPVSTTAAVFDDIVMHETSNPPMNNLVMWFDACDLSTITDTAGAVSQWDDKSGATACSGVCDATPLGAAGTEPVTDSVTFNDPSASGLNVLDFDGTQYLTTATLAGANVLGNATIIVLAKRDTTGNADYFVDDDTDTNNFGVYATSGDLSAINSGAELTGSGIDTKWHLYTAAFDSAGNDELALDGASDISPGNAGSGSADILNIGADNAEGNFLDGQIAEILVYSSTLSAEGQIAAECYLSTKWNLGLARCD